MKCFPSCPITLCHNSERKITMKCVISMIDHFIWAELILQPSRRFTYVTAHSPTLPLLHLYHSSFSNPSFAFPTSHALHLIHLASRPWYYGSDIWLRSLNEWLYVCVFVWMYSSFRAREHQRSLALVLNDFLWLWWPVISGDGWDLRFLDICLTVEEKPRKKSQSGKLTRPGIEPGPARWEATMLPLDNFTVRLCTLV